MAAVADSGLSLRAPTAQEVWLTFGLSVLFHGLLAGAILLVPRFRIGTHITIPVSYTVSLVDAPPGGQGSGGPAPASTPPALAAPARVGAAPAPRPAPPAEELTLPGRRPARKAARPIEPSLRPPSVTGRETMRPAPPAPAPLSPAAPAAPLPGPLPASASAGPGAGKGTGVEVAGSGAGGGSTLNYYLTLVDWKIQGNWTPVGATGGAETVVVVRFRVLRSGQVRDLELEGTSGNATLDASALRAIRQSLPLPPFPNLLSEPLLDLRYRFVMERG